MVAAQGPAADSLSCRLPADNDRLKELYPNWTCEPLSSQRQAIITIMRDASTSKEEFVFYADRLFRLLIEDALNVLPFGITNVKTPLNEQFEGTRFASSICGVSIVRAGESMEAALRAVCRGCRIGKILIQRNEQTLEPNLIYHKLPQDIVNRHVLLMDPMIGTGGSASKAIELLTEGYKVPQNKIIFCNLVCVEEGLRAIFLKYPNIKIVSALCDPILCDKTGYIRPGFGDFGDRYFGTDKLI